MAYLRASPQDDEEQKQQLQASQQGGGPAPAATPNQNMMLSQNTGGTIQPTQASASNPQPAQQGPTRSPMGFVNLSRFLEANPNFDAAKGINKIAGDVTTNEQNSFDTVTKPVTDWYTKQGTAGYLNAGHPGPLTNQDLVGWAKQGAAGDAGAEGKLKYLTTDQTGNVPQNINWAPDNADIQKIGDIQNPGQMGPHSLSRMLAGNNPNYTLGMEGLDSAVLRNSSQAQQAAKDAKTAFDTSIAGKQQTVSGLNAQNDTARQSSKDQTDWAKTTLKGILDAANSGAYGPDADLGQYNEIAKVLGIPIGENVKKNNPAYLDKMAADRLKEVQKIADKADAAEYKRIQQTPQLQEHVFRQSPEGVRENAPTQEGNSTRGIGNPSGGDYYNEQNDLGDPIQWIKNIFGGGKKGDTVTTPTPTGPNQSVASYNENAKRDKYKYLGKMV